MGLSFWNDTESRFFRRRDDGDWDFFPHGDLGHGYRVNAEQRQEISVARRHYASLSFIAYTLGITLPALGGALEGGIMLILTIVAIIFVALRGYWLICLRPLWRDLPKTAWRDAWVHKIPKFQIVYLLLIAPLFGLFGLLMLWHGRREDDSTLLIVGVLCLLFGVAGTWFGIAWWRMQRVLKRAGS